MSKLQKLKQFFFKTKKLSESKDIYLEKTYMKFFSLIAGLIFIYFGVIGIIYNISILYISIFYLSILIIFGLIKDKINTSFEIYKITLYLLNLLLILSLFFINCVAIKLFYFYFLLMFAYIFFDQKKMLIFSYSSLLILNILYFTLNQYHQFILSKLIFLDVTYIFLTLIFIFLKKIESLKLLRMGRLQKLEHTKIEQEKKIVAFALHQLRSTINNYVVFSEIKKKSNSEKEQKELDKINQLSIEDLCATFSLLENVTGKDDKILTNCSVEKIIQKIISFYKINNQNIRIVTYNKNYNLPNKTDHQYIILKAIFSVFELINVLIENEKTIVKLEFIDDDLYFIYMFTVENKNYLDYIKNDEFNVVLEMINNNFISSNSNLQIKYDKDIVFELNFNKEYFIQKENEIEENFNKDIEEETKFKLLLGEDDEINQRIYFIGFEKYFGRIDIGDNGSDVLKRLEKSKYDLLVMDLQMPTMNGIETIEKIRQIEELTGEHLLVIAITANTLIYNRQDILNFGFDDYFIKPFKIKEIYQSFINLKNN